MGDGAKTQCAMDQALREAKGSPVEQMIQRLRERVSPP
jgi:hypothetical protein